MNRFLFLCLLYLFVWSPSKAVAACEDIAGEWAGLWSERYCDGYGYSGTWTGLVTNDCKFRDLGDLGEITGKINPRTKAVTASGVDSEGCGKVKVNGTVTGRRMHGSYKYSRGGGGSFTGDIRVPFNYQLSVSKSGAGKVTSSLKGIKCGGDCKQYYPVGARLVLTAKPARGSRLSGWTGCDTASGLHCRLRLQSNRAVTASFKRAPSESGGGRRHKPSSGAALKRIAGSPDDCRWNGR